jgi:integrase/recombinase XerD
MITDQASLFDRKKYAGTPVQPYQIAPPTANQHILKTLPAYYAYLQCGEYSKYTPDDFTSDVKKFGLFVKDKPLGLITSSDIQQWVGELKKTMTPRTVSRKITALNNYFTWLETEKVLTANPAQSIRAARVTSPLPDILFDSECKQLRAAASHDPRAYLLVLLLLETGIKKAELFELKVAHFDVSDAYAPELWIKHAKKQLRKDRKLKLPPEMSKVFADYIERYQITDTVFPYSARTIQQVLTDAAKQAGLHKKVTASVLRDTFVVRSLRQGAKLDDIIVKIGLNEFTSSDARKKYLKLAAAGL